MQFLKTLFWVILAVALVLFAGANWNPVPIKIWGGQLVDIKLPLLVVVSFLLGFLPTLIIYRARLWTLKRRLEAQGQVHVANMPGVVPRPPAPAPDADRPAA